MQHRLFEFLDQAVSALKVVTPATIDHEHLSSSISILEGIPINELIEEFQQIIPVRADDEKGKQQLRKELDLNATELNKRLDGVNDELKRIKSIRQTLNLGALDPLIRSAQRIVRPLYNLSADWRE
jgi:septation ring formation regulator EzrA